MAESRADKARKAKCRAKHQAKLKLNLVRQECLFSGKKPSEARLPGKSNVLLMAKNLLQLKQPL
jgi:hypothetical protein